MFARSSFIIAVVSVLALIAGEADAVKAAESARRRLKAAKATKSPKSTKSSKGTSVPTQSPTFGGYVSRRMLLGDRRLTLQYMMDRFNKEG